MRAMSEREDRGAVCGVRERYMEKISNMPYEFPVYGAVRVDYAHSDPVQGRKHRDTYSLEPYMERPGPITKAEIQYAGSFSGIRRKTPEYGGVSHVVPRPPIISACKPCPPDKTGDVANRLW